MKHYRLETKVMKSTAILAVCLSLGIKSIAGDPGAMIGPFPTDSEGFLMNWVVLEPISLTGLQHNETGVRAVITRDDLKEAMNALPKAGDKLNIGDTGYEWHFRGPTNYVLSLTGFASEFHKPVVNEVFCGVAYVTSPEDMKDARLAIGSDDDSVWWVNGKEVIAAYGVRQTSVDDNVSKRLLLKKGVNIVRFAVIQGDGPSDCCARFYDAGQRPITNLTVSLTPP